MKFMFAFFLKELFLAFYLFIKFLGLLSGIIYFQTKINQDLNAIKNDLILLSCGVGRARLIRKYGERLNFCTQTERGYCAKLLFRFQFCG